MRESLVLLLLMGSVFLGRTAEAWHSLYIGMMEVVHAQGSKETVVRVRVFQDDLRSAVRAFSPSAYQAAEPEKWPSLNQGVLQSYFGRHLSLTINSKKAALKWHSTRLEGEVYWVEFRVQSAVSWKSLDIRADFLTELFPDQSNVVQVESNGRKWFSRTSGAVPTAQFRLY
ncbi:MAG: DUF6702 family protein [Haliscomenobacter sp.]